MTATPERLGVDLHVRSTSRPLEVDLQGFTAFLVVACQSKCLSIYLSTVSKFVSFHLYIPSIL